MAYQRVRYVVLLGALLSSLLHTPSVRAQTPAPAPGVSQPAVIHVGVLNNPPYAFMGPHGLDGISVAAFRIIAAKNNWQPDFILEQTQDDLANAIITHQADIGIGGITPTPELGFVADFSDVNQMVPLALLVKDEGTGTKFWHILGRTSHMLFSVEMLALFVIGLGAVLAGGYLICKLERKRAPEMFPPELRDNVWWAAQTLIAHNCGAKLPLSERGRYLAIVLMLGGTVFTAEITAVLTTSLASALDDTAPITGIGDIGPRPIATVRESYAQDWLQQKLITAVSYKNVEDCVQAVEKGEVPAAVFDEIALRRVLASGRYPDLRIAGDNFGSHPHAFMVSKRSPYMAPLNAGLETLLRAPEWQALTARWIDGDE